MNHVFDYRGSDLCNHFNWASNQNILECQLLFILFKSIATFVCGICKRLGFINIWDLCIKYKASFSYYNYTFLLSFRKLAGRSFCAVCYIFFLLSSQKR